MSPRAIGVLNSWRAQAQAFVATNPSPGSLDVFVSDWQQRRIGHGSAMRHWPPEWPLLDLLFTLITWLIQFQEKPEGQVYLEAIARTVSEAAQLSSYRGQIVNDGNHRDASRRQLIRQVFEPIASGMIDVDEDLMPHVPRNYFPIMTVHQAKGLEFPLVIVDVGSRWKTNHRMQAPLRFPSQGDGVHMMEDCIAPFSPVGPERQRRSGVLRAWDDLRRLYFVAYSRPENVLLLVGLTSQLRTTTPVQSLATGDCRSIPRFIDYVDCGRWNRAMGWNIVALV
jgi:DNA helicase-2/ATP-dependent DNA helicase PcrA